MTPDPMRHVIYNLESVFRTIEEERMLDIPILNPALKVQAVGFRRWETDYLGILITPWFMNLMLIPDHDLTEDTIKPDPGSKRVKVFPSGRYEFIAGEEPGIGHYEVCSLFSPAFEFDDHAVAVATAEAIMLALMDEENRDETTMHEETIRQVWQQEEVEPVNDDQNPESEQQTDQIIPPLSELKDQKISRRSLLRGDFLGSGK